MLRTFRKEEMMLRQAPQFTSGSHLENLYSGARTEQIQFSQLTKPEWKQLPRLFPTSFVSLCSCSDFFHGDEMQLGKVMKKVATELTKLGVPVTHNPAMWSELANFIDYKRVTLNPKSIDTQPAVGEPWDSSAAFACIDKFPFREKMLFACVVGDDTINSFESTLEEFPLDGVLTQLPSEVTLTEAAANCERISTDALRKIKTVNPLTNVDFDAINPKLMYKEDRFWYRVPVRGSPMVEGFYQDDPHRMVMCSQCSINKRTGNEFDVFEEAAKYCPNCASNFCRKFYFNENAPERAEIVLRWAASIIIHEKKLTPYWGAIDPTADIRAWLYETIRTFRVHPSGVGKFVSHFGTTRMNARSAANAMAQGQGKQLTVERHQVTGEDGQTQEYFQFSYDHGNRMYSDYMKKLFSTPEIFQMVGSEEPTEEVLGDCVEVCLGILRVAMMYEGCDQDLFKWKDVNGILTGLEHSLMMYNASAYPSGLKNRKASSSKSKSKGKAYTFDECQDVPIISVPKRKSPVIKNEDFPDIADALMSDATLPTTLTEGKTLGPASSSTEANRSEPVAAPGMDAAKRRKVIPQTQMQDIFGGMLDFLKQAISTESGCLNCMSNDHKVEDCPHDGAVEWMNMLIGVRDGIIDRNPTEDISIPKWLSTLSKMKSLNPDQGTLLSTANQDLFWKSLVKMKLRTLALEAEIQGRWGSGGKDFYSRQSNGTWRRPNISHRWVTFQQWIKLGWASIEIGPHKCNMGKSYRLKQKWLCSPIRPGVIVNLTSTCSTRTTIIRLSRSTRGGGTKCFGTILVIVVPLRIVMSWDGSR